MPLYFSDMDASNIQPDNSTSTGSKVSVWVALLISVIIHIFLFLTGNHFGKAPVTTRLVSREFQIVMQTNNQSTSTPIMESNISKERISKPTNSVAPKKRSDPKAPARTITQKPPAAQPPLNRNAAPPVLTDIPARVSILESAKNIIASEATTFNSSRSAENSSLSEEDGGNIFSPALRQDLKTARARSHHRGTKAEVLNNSFPTDSRERVSMNGKCFRLENIGGRGDQRAWYRIKCIGAESTSDTMQRALLENLKRR